MLTPALYSMNCIKQLKYFFFIVLVGSNFNLLRYFDISMRLCRKNGSTYMRTKKISQLEKWILYIYHFNMKSVTCWYLNLLMHFKRRERKKMTSTGGLLSYLLICIGCPAKQYGQNNWCLVTCTSYPPK